MTMFCCLKVKMYKPLDSIFVSVRVCVRIEETRALECNELAGFPEAGFE